MKEDFDGQFALTEGVEERLRWVLERRIEELNLERAGLHGRLVSYADNEGEMKAIAEEYRALTARKETLTRDIDKMSQ